MDTLLQPLAEAAEGLLFMSESDHPFEVVELGEGPGQPLVGLQQLAGSSGMPEKQSLDYLLRNSTIERDTDGEEQRALAHRFIQLKNVLNKTLSHIDVYRFGTMQIDIFIIGQLPNGHFAGLRTKAVET